MSPWYTRLAYRLQTRSSLELHLGLVGYAMLAYPFQTRARLDLHWGHCSVMTDHVQRPRGCKLVLHLHGYVKPGSFYNAMVLDDTTTPIKLLARAYHVTCSRGKVQGGTSTPDEGHRGGPAWHIPAGYRSACTQRVYQAGPLKSAPDELFWVPAWYMPGWYMPRGTSSGTGLRRAPQSMLP